MQVRPWAREKRVKWRDSNNTVTWFGFRSIYIYIFLQNESLHPCNNQLCTVLSYRSFFTRRSICIITTHTPTWMILVNQCIGKFPPYLMIYLTTIILYTIYLSLLLLLLFQTTDLQFYTCIVQITLANSASFFALLGSTGGADGYSIGL